MPGRRSPEPEPEPGEGRGEHAGALARTDSPVPAKPPPEPYRSVEAVLVGIAARFEGPGPTADEVRRHLGRASPLRKLVDKLGVEATVNLYVWVAEHIPRGLSWGSIWEQHMALGKQMRDGVKRVPLATPSGDRLSGVLAALEAKT